MAQMYGPMAYRPNPGISLGSNPMQQFQPPAPVAPVQQGLGPMPSLVDWLSDNGMKRARSITTDRGTRTINNAVNKQNNQYWSAMSELGYQDPRKQILGAAFGKGGDVMGGLQGLLGGAGRPSTPAPAAASNMGLDQVAASYAKFLNGGQ